MVAICLVNKNCPASPPTWYINNTKLWHKCFFYRYRILIRFAEHIDLEYGQEKHNVLTSCRGIKIQSPTGQAGILQYYAFDAKPDTLGPRQTDLSGQKNSRLHLDLTSLKLARTFDPVDLEFYIRTPP